MYRSENCLEILLLILLLLNEPLYYVMGNVSRNFVGFSNKLRPPSLGINSRSFSTS